MVISHKIYPARLKANFVSSLQNNYAAIKALITKSGQISIKKKEMYINILIMF